MQQLKMLIKVCLLLLSVGVFASFADSSSKPQTEDEFIDQMKSIFPPKLLPQFEASHPIIAHAVHLFFNSIFMHFVYNDPVRYWSKYNQNDFNRIKMDAVFYEYLTKFANKTKPRFFNSLPRSRRSHEDIVVDRIGEYLDNLSAAEVSADKSETEESGSEVHIHRPHIKCTDVYPVYGIPGKDFPNYCEIPDTSFTCADKLIPGIYADTETRCQVFHACWPRRIDSYICPVGSTFNQALLTCDFWYNSECNSSSHFLDHPPLAKGEAPRDAEPTTPQDDETGTTTEIPSASIREFDISEYDGKCLFLGIEPLHMIINPSDCKTKYLKPITEKPSDELQFDVKRFERLIEDILIKNLKLLGFVIKADESGKKWSAQLPGWKNDWPTPELASKLMKVVDEAVTEKPTDEFEIDEKRYDRVIQELLIPSVNMLEFVIRAAQLGRQGYATPKLVSEVMKVVNESPLKNADIDTTSEEQIYISTTELPADDQKRSSQRINSKFMSMSGFQAAAQENVRQSRSVRESTLLEPSKPSEDSKKRVFDTVNTSLNLGGRILNDGVLPLVEKIVLESHSKKYKS